MRIVIVGAGVMGFHLASQLAGEGHDISVVDSSPELIRRVDEKMDVLGICGDASLPSVVEKAGVARADLVIAVTNSDTTNLLVSLLARKLGAKKCIVRVRHSEFSDGGILSREDVGADLLINPIDIAAQFLERLVRNPGATDVAEFANGELLLWGYRVSTHSPLANTKLRDLRKRYAGMDALIVAIKRGDGTLVIPTGDDQLLENDQIYVFIRRNATGEFRDLVHPEKEHIDKAVIIGASRVGVELARRLQDRLHNLTMVEPDRAAAERAAEELAHTSVLCGDATDPDFAHEYDLREADYFLALTDNDQTNLMNALLERKRGGKRIAVLAQEPHYLEVLPALGIDVVVNPRLQTVSAILAHIRKGRILSVTRIGDTGAEAREYIATKGCPIVGRPLRDAGVPRGAIISAILRGDGFEIPRGDSQVMADDRVVILALPEAVSQVDRLFSKRRLFGG